ncbi:2-amino-4-hydroxy-6-hydroxymethyldihydropteridine diphosphokinase [Mucilaginibacter sp. KACC 22773]|uniref:2-amino-4-hydroxy-6- hydroxymethyldihydropteridine diphosphokinase n=1 Tax=Mucilaginibacter sp. KACC 22773 TaxID=3025671 RepID=UPI0023651313|nr:2-amino-4-hydroxy-6-hydroxymethyldihydropteridine diphosphokinase [Mucilaginibacter sp. KACC 22773]WDF80145.1 2-amino-4-hydroxy-6-hydroxymethyldihydropteridine diphosphokinase [Mucilaginibacter sp. KACC 22773]
MIDVFLLLGSNLGNRKLLLNEAIERIEAAVGPVLQASSVYETQSWGKTEAPDYLNQVLLLQTDLKAREVLGKILAIELLMGRRREEKWGSRTIDIDILFYGDAIIDEPDLKIPHPEMHKRRFTLAPLAELVPEFEHPLIKKNILQLKNELIDDLVVKKV